MAAVLRGVDCGFAAALSIVEGLKAFGWHISFQSPVVSFQFVVIGELAWLGWAHLQASELASLPIYGGGFDRDLIAIQVCAVQGWWHANREQQFSEWNEEVRWQVVE